METDKTRRATIYDVASESGVSIATVSRFVNSPESVNPETGLRISDVVDRLDYIPQGNIGGRTERTVGRVGVLTPFFPSPSFVHRLESMLPIFRDQNYEMVVYTVENEEQLNEYLLSVPFTRRIDGLILMSVQLTDVQKRNLEKIDLQVVMIEVESENFSRVVADNQQGGRQAGELFARKNYFPCAYMGALTQKTSYGLGHSSDRLAGFCEGLRRAGHNPNDVQILKSHITVEDAQREFNKALDGECPPRGVFAMSDIQAIGILRAVRERGLKIPEDVAILGFDDIDAAGWMDISTVTQHLGDSGQAAADLLLDLMSGRTKSVRRIYLQVDLVERSTT